MGAYSAPPDRLSGLGGRIEKKRREMNKEGQDGNE